VRAVNPTASIVEAASPVSVEDPSVIEGKRVLVVEDGPTLTHGEMEYGAGVVAAEKYGALDLVDPRPFTTKTISDTFDKYPGIGIVLPAMGYSDEQIQDLEKTIADTECEGVVIGTPIDLRRIVKIKQPSTRVEYELCEIGSPNLTELLAEYTK